MILFEKVRWKNFLSTGDQYSEIDFQGSSTTLIVGSNGSGKSTVLDALTFGLFSKPFRKINKSQLINTVNEKDLRVEVEFVIGTITWKVIRGIKPNIFEIWRNDKLLDQFASVNDQQKWLEQNVVKMNYKSFTQIVILGSSNFVPFMQLSATNRREVIEDLLDIKIFTSMNNIIKDKIRQVKEKTKTLDLKKESLIDKVSMQERFMNEIETRGKEDIEKKKKKMDSLGDDICVCIMQNEEAEDSIYGLQQKQEKLTAASDTLAKLNNLKGQISNKVSMISKEDKFFKDNTVCPTCTQEIDEDFRINKINDAQNKAKKLQSGYKELEDTIKKEQERERQFTKISKEITKLTHGISQNNSLISNCQKQQRDLKDEVQTLTNQIENRNTEHEKLETFKQNLQDTYEELGSQKEKIKYFNYTYELLKDGGVKAKIIKKYLPLINQQINRYLQMMDFYINFTLDEEFNETVQSPIHEDFSYASFSEGEKQRIDLALLFTWREVAKFKNSISTNLMVLDEVFDSSLDGQGTEEFLKIIKYVIEDANIFVISHKTGLDDRFENVVRFEKIKGFSRMVS
tara:strand:- start:5644 stop:7356 length:1713 start_codon:yes stop_codon:yes gene_type:complete